MNTRKVSPSEYKKHFSNINKLGFTKIKSFFSKKLSKKILGLVINHQGSKRAKVPAVWNKANVIYNLQNKDLTFVRLFGNNFFENILKSKLNDPHYRNAPKNFPNYTLNNLQARSSQNSPLFLHIDSGLPTGDVTTFIQILVLLEKSTKKTGCTVVVPKSHLSKKYSNRNQKKYHYLEGEAGDVFIWDGNLWHGSIPNVTKNSRWAVIGTFCNWIFKPVFDIPRGLPQKIFSKLTLKEKMLLGFFGIPPVNEEERITRSLEMNKLEKQKNKIYKIIV